MGDFVKGTRFDPEAKFAGSDVFRYAFGGGADAGKFVVVNGTGTIARNVGDEVAFHQVDEIGCSARANDVSTDHEDDGAVVFTGLGDAIGEDGKVGIVKGGDGCCQVGDLINTDVVFPFR